MGSWDATCVTTGLPIKSGDPVVAFFLADNGPSLRMLCNVRKYWTPASLPIYGAYTDQGEIETDIHPKVEAFIRAQCSSWESWASHFLNWAPPESVQDYLKYAERNPEHAGQATLTSSTEEGGKAQIGMCLVHRKAYDLLIEGRDNFSAFFDGFWHYPSACTEYLRERYLERYGQCTIDQMVHIEEDWPEVLSLLREIWEFEAAMARTRRVWQTDLFSGKQEWKDTIPAYQALCRFGVEKMQEQLDEWSSWEEHDDKSEP